MKRARPTFRGARIGILGCGDADRLALSRQLNRLGATIVPVVAGDLDSAAEEGGLDALFLDLEAAEVRRPDWPDAGRCVPIVALMGSEAPSQMSLMERLSVSAHLMKPLRSTGILASLWTAHTRFEERRSFECQISRLGERLKLRRFVVSAQLDLMTRLGVSEADAFARLRGAAMEQRTTIEQICLKYLAGEVSVSE